MDMEEIRAYKRPRLAAMVTKQEADMNTLAAFESALSPEHFAFSSSTLSQPSAMHRASSTGNACAPFFAASPSLMHASFGQVDSLFAGAPPVQLPPALPHKKASIEVRKQKDVLSARSRRRKLKDALVVLENQISLASAQCEGVNPFREADNKELCKQPSWRLVQVAGEILHKVTMQNAQLRTMQQTSALPAAVSAPPPLLPQPVVQLPPPPPPPARVCACPPMPVNGPAAHQAASHCMFSSLFFGASIMMMCKDVYSDVVLDINYEFERALSLPKQEIMGRTLGEAMRANFLRRGQVPLACLADDYTLRLTSERQALLSGEKSFLSSDVFLLTATGEIRPIRATQFLVRGTDGTPCFIAVLAYFL